MPVSDLQSIIDLFKALRKDRKILNWGEFAEEIDYDRTYISRVVNGHEPLTQDIIDKVNQIFGTTEDVAQFTKTVVPELKEKYVRVLEDLRDKDKLLTEIKESLSKLALAVDQLAANKEKIYASDSASALDKKVSELPKDKKVDKSGGKDKKSNT